MSYIPYPKKPAIRNCVFCGRTDINGEHLVSQWIHDLLPQGTTRYEVGVTIYSPSNTPSKIEQNNYKYGRSGDGRHRKVNCVCTKHCNNGWMREKVDEPAMAVLPKLITGEECRLSEAEQKIVATWATLKAMVLEYDDLGRQTTHHMQRKFLMNHIRPPKGWRIWIADTPRGNLPTVLGSTPFNAIYGKRIEKHKNGIEVVYNANATTIVIGRMFMFVLRAPLQFPLHRWDFEPSLKGKLISIWPATGYSIKWPPRELSGSEAKQAARSIHDAVVRDAQAMGFL